MGRNKAFLAWSGGTLLEHVAGAVTAAVGSVTLVGDPAVYGELGFPVCSDRIPGSGPLAGIEAALTAGSEWNLLAACDMPGIDASFLRRLKEAAESLTELPNRAVVCALSPDGRLHPLCAAYHQSCLAPVREALEGGERRVFTALERLNIHSITSDCTQNVNTPFEWSSFLESRPA